MKTSQYSKNHNVAKYMTQTNQKWFEYYNQYHKYYRSEEIRENNLILEIKKNNKLIFNGKKIWNWKNKC